MAFHKSRFVNCLTTTLIVLHLDTCVVAESPRFQRQDFTNVQESFTRPQEQYGSVQGSIVRSQGQEYGNGQDGFVRSQGQEYRNIQDSFVRSQGQEYGNIQDSFVSPQGQEYEGVQDGFTTPQEQDYRSVQQDYTRLQEQEHLNDYSRLRGQQYENVQDDSAGPGDRNDYARIMKDFGNLRAREYERVQEDFARLRARDYGSAQETYTRRPVLAQGDYLVSSIVDVVLNIVRKSKAWNYVPKNARDIFDFLRDNYQIPAQQSVLSEYTYVIVGAGPAGCVLASRLTEDPQTRVLLIEAGVPEGPASAVPVLATHMLESASDWAFRMERVPGICMAMEDQRCVYPRGRGLGGTSIINFMIYTRGNRIDWDRVAAQGNPGWSYNEVLPYFLKSEMADLKGLENSPYHNRNGLMSVEYIRYRSPLMDAFLKSSVELGNEIVDYNQGDLVGFSPLQVHTLKGRRHTAARAFLYPYRDRKNLHILTNTRVTKININKKTQTATSVEYVRNKMRYKVRARKEIIICAGAFLSPQLLMLSGIGPKEHLDRIGVPVVKDLPVGQTMYDHMSFLGLTFLVNETGLGLVESEATQPRNIVNWLRDGAGPLTLAAGIEGIGYIKTKVSEETLNYPDIELLFQPAALSSELSETFRRKLRITDKFFKEVYGPIVERPCFSIAQLLLHPKSRGYIRLRDNNPFHRPMFYYDYFADKRDTQTLVEGVKYSLRMAQTSAFQKYGARVYDKHYPTCKEFHFGTDQYWECAIRSVSVPLQHQVGTCKMGPASDPEAVVDSELRVHGIKKLRVADTSIIPFALTAHTNAPSVMVGEKLADMLRNQRGPK